MPGRRSPDLTPEPDGLTVADSRRVSIRLVGCEVQLVWIMPTEEEAAMTYREIAARAAEPGAEFLLRFGMDRD